MEITSGIINRPKKVLIYGPEGIGKTTFASKFPDPVFIDTENGTDNFYVMRVSPSPTSWAMLMEYVEKFKQPGLAEVAKTLVIDTLDWAERLCNEHVCAKHKTEGIEDFGYGKGYTYVYEEFGKFLNLLQDVINNGITVVVTAHAATKKIESPEEATPYDSWGLKLSKGCVSLCQEWADMILFANYKIYVVKNSEKDKVGKVQGGKRVMYTTHHPCRVAKNRFGLDDELEFDYSAIAHIIENKQTTATTASHIPSSTPLDNDLTATKTSKTANIPAVTNPEKDFTPIERGSQDERDINATFPPEQQKLPSTSKTGPPHLKKLHDLMNESDVTESEIQVVVAIREYFPVDTPIENYPADFVEGVLIAAWPKVLEMIINTRNRQTEAS